MTRKAVTMLVAGIIVLVLVLVTQLAVRMIERNYPAEGVATPVKGATLNVVEIGPRDAPGPPIVLIHGATSTLGTMRVPLGEALARTHRVILIDRPGHGWSPRASRDLPPAQQAAMIVQALDKRGVTSAIFVVHSLAGALGALLPLDHPQRVAGLVMLAPVTHPWSGGVGVINDILTIPLLGPALAHTITMPLGLALLKPGVAAAFAPQTAPADFVSATKTPLVLRPANFLANAWDLTTLKQHVTAQAPRYPSIRTDVTVIAGDADDVVSTNIHARAFTRDVPGAKLVVLPGVGHMVPTIATDVVLREIEAMVERVGK